MDCERTDSGSVVCKGRRRLQRGFFCELWMIVFLVSLMVWAGHGSRHRRYWDPACWEPYLITLSPELLEG
jgi:hypothetical protein